MKRNIFVDILLAVSCRYCSEITIPQCSGSVVFEIVACLPSCLSVLEPQKVRSAEEVKGERWWRGRTAGEARQSHAGCPESGYGIHLCPHQRARGHTSASRHRLA